MVNEPSGLADTDRRERSRSGAEHAPALGAAANINPFGDLHALQHLTARLAKSLRRPMEAYVGEEARCWAEPLAVQRFGDYRAERPAGLTAWLQLQLKPGKSRAIIAIEGKFAFSMLDRFFGGDGETPATLPAEFTASGETLLHRLACDVAQHLHAAWETLAPIDFICTDSMMPLSAVPEIDGAEPMVCTRLGVAARDERPEWIDILYPVAALKPHTPSLTAKVIGGDPEPEPEWRNGLTRNAMGLRLPVRSVLAEPVVPLSLLMSLKPGDVIPISFGPEVPVMVARQKIGFGTVGTANGHAAIKMNRFESLSLEDAR